MRDEKNDFFVQSVEGEDEWMDLLYYSSLNIGAASTVALEAIMLKKPVITIAFDHLDQSSSLLLLMAQAPFYKEILERGDVSLVYNCNECIQSIKKFMYMKDLPYELPMVLSSISGTSVTNIVKKLGDKS